MSKTNHVRLIGHLGQTPKLVETKSGSFVTSVSLATHDVFKDKHGAKQETTAWHNLVAFGNLAELLAKYTQKGSKLMVIGRLQTRQYLDKQENERYSTEVICEELLFLDSAEKTKSE